MVNPWRKFSSVNPQREQGHREISNKVLQALIEADFTAAEYKVSLFIIDRTWGFGKQTDSIAIAQFAGATKLADRTIQRTLANLKKKRVVCYAPSRKKGVTRGSPLHEFLFNKHYDTWIGKGDKSGKGDKPCKTRVTRMSPTKESVTKERKNIPPSSSSNGGSSPLIPEPRFEELLSRYSESEQTAIQECFKAVAMTRAAGKVKDSVLLAELKYWSNFEPWKVISAIRTYLDGEHHLTGKNEKYLRGIIRNSRRADRPRGSVTGQPKTGSMLDFINPEECCAAD